MNENNLQRGNCEYSLMTLMLCEDKYKKFIHFSKKIGIEDETVILGKSIVQNHTLNLLGIFDQKNFCVRFFVEKRRAKELLDLFEKELQISSDKSSVAYLHQINMISTNQSKELNSNDSESGAFEDNTGNKIINIGENSMYKKLTVVINRGCGEDVMDVAVKKGASYGMIFHGKEACSRIHSVSILGMSIEQEKDVAIFIVKDELVVQVVDEIEKSIKENMTDSDYDDRLIYVETIDNIIGL